MATAHGYRADIDGLRAIAVISVLVFHAFPSVLHGGFVGVDVFFVISGFLISGILFRQMDENSLHLGLFYVRRIKRLFPALAVVLAASIGLGWLILFPEELRLLGRHVAAGSLFLSNVQLLSESGYFDVAARSKPLLHLWSLGVEEQFYFGLPLLIVLSRRRAKWLIVLLPLLFTGSFVLNVGLVKGAPAATFYLPFTRFWEFLAGSGLAWFGLKKTFSLPLLHSRGSVNLAGWVGLALLVGSVFTLDEGRSFPGWWALLPALGTCLVIAAGADAWPNRQLLSHPALVFIGLISYPLYLWHWPLLTFGNFIDAGISPRNTRVVALLLSALLAWLTYRFIERPARLSPALLCAAMAAIGCTGIWLYQGQGYWNRFPGSLASIRVGVDLAPLTRLDCGIAAGARAYTTECQSDRREKPVFAVIGDSHASALYPGLVKDSRSGQRWMLIGRAGCAPVTGIARVSQSLSDDAEECAQSNGIAADALVRDRDIRVIVIAISSRISGTLSTELSEGQIPQYSGDFVEGLSQTIGRFEGAGKRVVFLVDNPPLPGPNLCLGVAHAGIVRRVSDECSVSPEQLGDELREYREMVCELAARNPRLQVFDPTNLLCEHGRCNIARDGLSLYSYTDHLSDYGNGIVAKGLIPFVVRAAMPQ